MLLAWRLLDFGQKKRVAERDWNIRTMKLKISILTLSLVWVAWLLLTMYYHVIVPNVSVRDINNNKNISSTTLLLQLKSPATPINTSSTHSYKKTGFSSLLPFSSSFSSSSFLSLPSLSPLGSSGGRNLSVRGSFTIKWRKIAGKWNTVRREWRDSVNL